MQPSRISSEAPEAVVLEERDKFSLTTFAESVKRGNSQYQKQFDDRETETKNYPPPPRLAPSPAPLNTQEQAQKRRNGRTLGLMTTVALVIVAFLIGGGIGGGVGGAIAVNAKSSAGNQATVTVTAPGSESTIIVDTAGCPSVNNSTYSPEGNDARFLKLCGTDIQPLARQNIDLANSTQGSFDACLDMCAVYQGCVAATWVIFSQSTPSRNSVCFLKNGTGQETEAASGQYLASAYLIAT